MVRLLYEKSQPSGCAHSQKNAGDDDGRRIHKRNLLISFANISHLAAAFLTALGLPF